MIKLAVAALLLLASPALAQQQEASPEVQALSAKVMREISEGLQCQAASIKLAKENDALKARVKELEATSSPDHKAATP